jgi:serine/threonine-protein kinase
MAEIFLARESGPRGAGRELVVKRVLPHVAADPKLMDMFIQEAQLSLRLRHPNICPIVEFGEDESGAFFLAMEWVHGVSLARLAARARDHGGIPVRIAVQIIADIAGALHHAHTAKSQTGEPLGIVHRDVTPENIMVSFDGNARLLDFGIAKASTQLDKTQAGVLKGKFAYMSPEQYQGDPLDGRSDVFSLGVCLFELLTGQPLYARANEYETVAAIILDAEAPKLRDVRPELPQLLDSIVQTALAKIRMERFPTADAMQAALTRFLADEKDVVRQSDVARFVQKLFPNEAREGPRLERKGIAFSVADEAPAIRGIDKLALDAQLDDIEEELESRSKRKTVAVVLIAVIVVLALLGVAGLALQQGPTGGGGLGNTSPEGHERE